MACLEKDSSVKGSSNLLVVYSHHDENLVLKCCTLSTEALVARLGTLFCWFWRRTKQPPIWGVQPHPFFSSQLRAVPPPKLLSLGAAAWQGRWRRRCRLRPRRAAEPATPQDLSRFRVKPRGCVPNFGFQNGFLVFVWFPKMNHQPSHAKHDPSGHKPNYDDHHHHTKHDHGDHSHNHQRVTSGCSTIFPSAGRKKGTLESDPVHLVQVSQPATDLQAAENVVTSKGGYSTECGTLQSVDRCFTPKEQAKQTKLPALAA